MTQSTKLYCNSRLNSREIRSQHTNFRYLHRSKLWGIHWSLTPQPISRPPPESHLPRDEAMFSRGLQLERKYYTHNPEVMIIPWYHPNECLALCSGTTLISNHLASARYWDDFSGTVGNFRRLPNKAGWWGCIPGSCCATRYHFGSDCNCNYKKSARSSARIFLQGHPGPVSLFSDSIWE